MTVKRCKERPNETKKSTHTAHQRQRRWKRGCERTRAKKKIRWKLFFLCFPWYWHHDRKEFFKCPTPPPPSFYHSQLYRFFFSRPSTLRTHKERKKQGKRHTHTHPISDSNIVCQQKPFAQYKISMVKTEYSNIPLNIFCSPWPPNLILSLSLSPDIVHCKRAPAKYQNQ